MKKLNFNNQPTEDDEQLIRLLKEATVETPSAFFSESTLNRIVNESRKKQIFKPVRVPIYLMLLIVVMLILPFITSSGPVILNSSRELELFNISDALISQSLAWYGLTILILCFLSLAVSIFQRKNSISRSTSKQV